VDDDPAIREALTAALKGPYIVDAVASGVAACAILRSHLVDAIILDAVLGNEHGLDLVDRFRSFSGAPIVILTGHGTEELAIRALRAHVAEYLKKPVSLPALHAVLEHLIPQEQEASELVARACRYLEAHPPKRFRAADLAGQIGVSEAHLRRLFRAACGKTPRQYLAEVRMRGAALLLRTTDRSVKQIALEVGFPDAKLFRRTFVRLMAMSPQAWRRQGRTVHQNRTDATSGPEMPPFCPKTPPVSA
jgi:AraC-like DNA-binding protein